MQINTALLTLFRPPRRKPKKVRLIEFGDSKKG